MTERTYALIVAVENYNQKNSFSKVVYAKKDAQDFADTLIALGVPTDNIKVVIDGHATKTSIEAELTQITAHVQRGDRGIFYFAGHGAYVEKSNVLVPVDGYKLMTKDTCVGIDYIMGKFKQSKSNTWLLFLDCCHSGFQPGNLERDIDETFEADELIRKYRDEEYLLGFASCGSHQTSFSHPNLSNGIWTHFLMKAFAGEAKGIYENGLLFSDKLQSYLSEEVYQFVKLNVEDRPNQKPVLFGSQTDRFIIADLNPLFEQRRKRIEAQKIADGVDYTRLSIASKEKGSIKSLPGFIRAYNVPNEKNNTTDRFVKKIGNELVQEASSDLVAAMKSSFSYKRKEVNITVDIGETQIITPDFTCYVSISQDDENPTLYLIEKSITEINNAEVIQSKEFDEAFKTTFNRLVFNRRQKIDIEHVIDTIEDLPDESGIEVKYDDTDLSWCKLLIKGIDFEVFITPYELSIVSTYSSHPHHLIDAFRKTANAISNTPNLLLLR